MQLALGVRAVVEIRNLGEGILSEVPVGHLGREVKGEFLRHF